jgi:hypothetical protein
MEDEVSPEVAANIAILTAQLIILKDFLFETMLVAIFDMEQVIQMLDSELKILAKNRPVGAVQFLLKQLSELVSANAEVLDRIYRMKVLVKKETYKSLIVSAIEKYDFDQARRFFADFATLAAYMHHKLSGGDKTDNRQSTFALVQSGQTFWELPSENRRRTVNLFTKICDDIIKSLGIALAHLSGIFAKLKFLYDERHKGHFLVTGLQSFVKYLNTPRTEILVTKRSTVIRYDKMGHVVLDASKQQTLADYLAVLKSALDYIKRMEKANIDFKMSLSNSDLGDLSAKISHVDELWTLIDNFKTTLENRIDNGERN